MIHPGVTKEEWLQAFTQGIREGVVGAFEAAFESQPIETYRSAGNLISDAIADGVREAMS